MLFNLITFLVTFIAGLGTGLLGIGGALIIYPCFLFIVPSIMSVQIPVGQISGIAAMQILIGSFSGFLAHRHSNLVDKSQLLRIAGLASIGTFTGGVLSGFFSREVMLWLYFSITLLAIFSMFRSVDATKKDDGDQSAWMNVCLISTGVFAGILGIGGAVLYIPILRYFKGLNTKESVPTSIFIVFIGAIMTFVGKSVSGQILYSLLPMVFLGAFSGARVGAMLSKRASSRALKVILLSILAFSATKVLIDLI